MGQPEAIQFQVRDNFQQTQQVAALLRSQGFAHFFVSRNACLDQLLPVSVSFGSQRNQDRSADAAGPLGNRVTVEHQRCDAAHEPRGVEKCRSEESDRVTCQIRCCKSFARNRGAGERIATSLWLGPGSLFKEETS